MVMKLDSFKFESGTVYFAVKSTTSNNREIYFGDVYCGTV